MILAFLLGCSGEQGNEMAQGNSASSTIRKVKFLEFYATWCRPCKKQAPVYEKLRREFRRIAGSARSPICWSSLMEKLKRKCGDIILTKS
jgi:thiol-disulfide isomerase/thioredoxin